MTGLRGGAGVDKGVEVFEGFVKGHKAGSAGDFLNVLADGFLGMELDSEGKAFVGALDGLDDVDAVGHGHTCHPQRSASNVAHDLMVPATA